MRAGSACSRGVRLTHSCRGPAGIRTILLHSASLSATFQTTHRVADVGHRNADVAGLVVVDDLADQGVDEPVSVLRDHSGPDRVELAEHAADEGELLFDVGEMPDVKDLTDVSRNALVKRTFATIDRAAVDFLANYQIQLLGDVTTELASGIQRTVTAAVLAGKSIPEVARDIGRVVEDKEAFRRAGKTVFKTAQQRATLIARTETIRAHNEGRKVFYRQVGITKVQWLTAHDERTCPVCRPLDGKVFGIGDVQGPPSHVSCRCTTIAVLPSLAT